METIYLKNLNLKQENQTMNQAISREDLIIEQVRQLPSEKQQEVLDFIEFLQGDRLRRLGWRKETKQ